MTETSFRFGSGDHLVGTLARPAPDRRRPDDLGMLLLNAGLVHRVGPHRINVKLARLAASRGVSSLRFDLSGRGDSRPADTGLDIRAQTTADIREAIAVLRERAGTRHVMVFGICSGADDGLAAALVEPSIDSLVLFDPYVYPTLRWRTRIVASKWRKLRTIERGALWRELRAAARPQQETGLLANFGREVPPIDAFAASLGTLCDRRVQVRLVYSGSVFDLRDYEAQCRMLVKGHGLDGRVRTEYLPEVDHVVTSVSAQRAVLARFDDWSAIGSVR